MVITSNDHTTNLYRYVFGPSKKEKLRTKLIKLKQQALLKSYEDHLKRVTTLKTSQNMLQDGGMFTVCEGTQPLVRTTMDEYKQRMREAIRMSEGVGVSEGVSEGVGVSDDVQSKVDNKYTIMCKCENGNCYCNFKKKECKPTANSTDKPTGKAPCKTESEDVSSSSVNSTSFYLLIMFFIMVFMFCKIIG